MNTKLFIPILFFSIFLRFCTPVLAAPLINNVAFVTGPQVEQFAKLEIKIDLTTSATNKFYPFDSQAHSSWTPQVQNIGLSGVSVDMLLLYPGQTDWQQATSLPCFYFQPYEEITNNGNVAFLPSMESPDFRCRLSPEKIGNGFQLKIRAQDNSGTKESSIYTYNVIAASSQSPTKKGFVKIKESDKRFFEFSNGETFSYPLVTANFGDNLTTIRERATLMGNSGIHFIRWFPTSEGNEYGGDLVTSPFAGGMESVWRNGPTWTTIENPDLANGKLFSFEPYYWTGQSIPAINGAKYQLKVRARVVDQKRFFPTLHFSDQNSVTQMITASDWNEYTLNIVNTSNDSTLTVYLHDGESDSELRSGYISIGGVELKREISNGVWGPNLLEKNDPDTFEYVDQLSSARLDEIFRESEKNGIYNKLTLFHKNDLVLDKLSPNGSTTDWDLNNFYTAFDSFTYWIKKAYVRYFIARWSYSPALHSLELANENDVGSQLSLNMSTDIASYVHELSPRRVLMSNSFWHWNGLSMSYWDDPNLDYVDKHWYEDKHVRDDGSLIDCAETPIDCEVVSTTWQDIVLNIRQVYSRFKEYATAMTTVKPFIRGETGVTNFGVSEQLGDGDGVTDGIKQETSGTYYHKKVWSQVGILGYIIDGEWWPRLWVNPVNNQFPNSTYDSFKIYASYDAYMKNESLNNGSYIDIGTDLNGEHLITSSHPDLRAFGLKDIDNKRVLVWVDNKKNTWRTPNYNTVATGNITIDMPNANYVQEIWNTRTGEKTVNPTLLNITSGKLTFSVSTAKDVAYKFYDPSVINPSPSPQSSPTPSPPPEDINRDHIVNAIDLKLIITNFINSVTCSSFICDVNSDGKVNLFDAVFVVKNFNQSW